MSRYFRTGVSGVGILVKKRTDPAIKDVFLQVLGYLFPAHNGDGIPRVPDDQIVEQERDPLDVIEVGVGKKDLL